MILHDTATQQQKCSKAAPPSLSLSSLSLSFCFVSAHRYSQSIGITKKVSIIINKAKQHSNNNTKTKSSTHAQHARGTSHNAHTTHTHSHHFPFLSLFHTMHRHNVHTSSTLHLHARWMNEDLSLSFKTPTRFTTSTSTRPYHVPVGVLRNGNQPSFDSLPLSFIVISFSTDKTQPGSLE